MLAFSKSDLTAALTQILPPLDPTTVTFRSVMEDLATHLSVDKNELKASHKEDLKQLIPDLLHLCKGGENKENESSAPEDDDDDDDEDVAPKKRPMKRGSMSRGRIINDSDADDDDEERDSSSPRKREASSEDEDADSDDSDEPTPKRRKKSTSTSRALKSKERSKAPRQVADKPKDSEGMAALKEIARVSGLLSPQVYALLKKAGSEDERESILRDRLEGARVHFSGRYPKKSDMMAAKRKHDKEKELDGIDTSLIISGGRSRRGAQTSYVAAFQVQDDEDEEEAETQQSDDDPKDDASSAESEESEAEF